MPFSETDEKGHLASVVELVYTLVLETSALRDCGFDSRLRHSATTGTCSLTIYLSACLLWITARRYAFCDGRMLGKCQDRHAQAANHIAGESRFMRAWRNSVDAPGREPGGHSGRAGSSPAVRTSGTPIGV